MGIALQILSKISNSIETKLLKTTKISDLDESVKNEFQNLYDQSSLNSKLLAVLLNGARTNSKNTFIMSLRLMRDLLEKDFNNQNISRRTLNDKEYRRFVATLVQNRIVEIVTYPEKISFQCPTGKAGTWRIIDEDCLKLIKTSIEEEKIFKYLDPADELNIDKSCKINEYRF